MKKSDTYTWDSLVWKVSKRNPDIRRCELILYPAETLLTEDGSRVYGPCRVVYRHNTKTQRISANYLPLDSQHMDLDNPLEYPCGYCGAERFEPCIGFNDSCTYRVFSTKGSTLV